MGIWIIERLRVRQALPDPIQLTNRLPPCLASQVREDLRLLARVVWGAHSGKNYPSSNGGVKASKNDFGLYVPLKMVI